MSSCPLPNCTDALKAPPPLEPNPDISGIGVLVGFSATAYMALILLIVHYVLVFDPAEAGLTNETHQANAIDTKVLNFIAKRVTRPRKTWGKALEKMILMISDQQMITGIALISSAIIQLNCGISAYHWQIAIYLVWFSSFTHIATLTFLRGYLHENTPMRWWRLLFMTALIALLVAALIPTGNGSWLPGDRPEMAGAPALCLFHYPSGEPDTTSFTSMLFSVLVLCVSYGIRAIKLFERSSKLSRLALRTMPGNAIKRYLQKLYVGSQKAKVNKWILSIPYYIILSVFLVLRSWMDLLESMFWEITWLLIALIWGTLRLFATRNATIDRDEDILVENSWGFGQCLATAMLILLLFSGIETYIETKRLVEADPLILTNRNRTSSSIDVDGAGENTMPQLSSTENSNNSFVLPEISPIELRACVYADVADQAAAATGADEQLQRINRSPTAISLEEQSLGTSSYRPIPIQRPDSEVELDEFPHVTPAAPTPVTELQHLPPHEQNYYDDKWYTMLAIFNFYQIILLCGGILSGAYNVGSPDDFPGILGSSREITSIFLSLINWILFYAPLSSFIITLPYVCLTKTHIKRCKWLHAVRRHLILAQLSRWLANILIFLIALSFTSITFLNLSPLRRGEILPYGNEFIAISVYGTLGIVYVPWSWIISRKLKRDDEILRSE